MSTDTQLAQRPSAEFIAGGFITLPLGVAIFLLTNDGTINGYLVLGLLLTLAGWVLLGVGLARVGAKVDDLYRHQVTRSRVNG